MKRVAIVTGGASGIGAAIACGLAAADATVLIADMNEADGEIRARDAGGSFVHADLTKREDCRKIIDAAIERYGRIDFLINNAGFQHMDPIPDFPEDEWDKLIAVMLTAPFLLTKYAWNHLIESNRGRIVNIASIHGVVASPYKAAYVAAKHGLVGLTKSAALEGGPHGLTVNAVCPGYVRTPLVEKQIIDQARTRNIPVEDVEEKVMLEPAAIKRLLDPQDIAALVVFLCSKAAWGITGTTQLIDLGWTAH